MSAYQVIGDTGRTIVKFLRENMTPEPIPRPEMIELCAPYEESDFRLTLYLYSILEDVNSKDVSCQDLSLNLFYLMTAFSKAELKTKAYEESCIIGSVMHLVEQSPVLRGSALEGTLSESNDNIRIMLHSVSMDEMSKIWTFSNVQYKLSVAYMVGPVHINTIGSIASKRVVR